MDGRTCDFRRGRVIKCLEGFRRQEDVVDVVSKAYILGSVSITTPEQTIQKARGETVHLPCMFTLIPEDRGPLFIDWIQLTGPQNEVVNRMFIVYLADKVYDNFYQDMKGRVYFTNNDVRSGDASINITNVQLSDAGTYQCGVSHDFGTAQRTIQLTVVG